MTNVYSQRTKEAYGAILEAGMAGEIELDLYKQLMRMVHHDLTGELIGAMEGARKSLPEATLSVG